MNGSTLLRGLRRGWPAVVALTLLGLVGGVGWSVLRSDHVSTVTVLVSAQSETAREEQLAQPDRFVQRQVRIVLSEEVLERAAQALTGTSESELRAAVDVEGSAIDDALEVSARAGSAQAAIDRADAVTASYVTVSEGTGTVLNRGRAEASATPARSAAVGAVGGLAAGLLVVLLLLNARPRVTGWSSLLDVPATVFPGSLPLRRGAGAGEVDVAVLSLAAWLHRDEPGAHSLVVAGSRRSDAVTLLPRLVDALEGIGRRVRVAPTDLGLAEKARWLEGDDEGDVVRLVATESEIEEAALAGLAGGRIVYLVDEGRDQVAAVVEAAQRLGGPARVRLVVVR